MKPSWELILSKNFASASQLSMSLHIMYSVVERNIVSTTLGYNIFFRPYFFNGYT